MPQISITDAKPGMVVTAHVTDASERVLVAAGSVLSQRHIESLKARAIAQLEVAEPVTHVSPTAVSEELIQELQQRFRENDATHPMIAELQRIWLRHAQARSSAGTK